MAMALDSTASSRLILNMRQAYYYPRDALIASVWGGTLNAPNDARRDPEVVVNIHLETIRDIDTPEEDLR